MPKDPLWVRVVAFLLGDVRGLALITAAYVVAGLVMLHYDYALNNEGLITYYVGRWASMDLAAVFFLQKAKPIVSLVYLLPAQVGVWLTMLAHTLVSALALPLIADFARRLGYRLPNLPALIVAFSPIYFLGGPAGLHNNDAIVGTVLALFLFARGHSLASGLVLGCLPWVRIEMAPLVGLICLHALAVEPNRRLIIGALLFPLLYSLAGAFYHQDLFWLLTYPPASAFNPENPIWRDLPIGLSHFLGNLLAVTPIAPVVVYLRLNRLAPIERTLLFYGVLMTVLLDVLPIFKIGNYGISPRYVSQLLPVLALLSARSLEAIWDGQRPSAKAGIAGFALAIWSATRMPGLVHVVPTIASVAAVLGSGLLAWGRTALAFATLVILAGPLLVPGTQIARPEVASYLDPMMSWLEANRTRLPTPVYTNSQVLAAYSELRGTLPGVEIRFLIGFDHLEGTLGLSNPHNGQREAVRRLCEQSFYGDSGVIASELRPEDLPPGTVFALRLDKRLDITLPPEVWAERLEIVHEQGGTRIARLRPHETD